MKIKKMVVGLGIATAVITIAISFKYSILPSELKGTEVESNIVYSVKYEDIAEFADLIVVGENTTKFEDRKHEITYFPTDNTAIEDFRSFAGFKVSEVYKDTMNSRITKNQEIIIVEPVALLTNKEGKKKLKQEHYKELQEGKEYVLFLKKSPHGNYYSIVRDNDGMNEVTSDEQIKDVLNKHKVKLEK